MKTLVTACVAIAVLIFVQHPDSILNKKVTEEEIRRERAKLFIETSSIENPSRRRAALEVLKDSYDDHDQLIDRLIDISSIGAEAEQIGSDLSVATAAKQKLDDCQVLRNRLSELRENLSKQSDSIESADSHLREAVQSSILKTRIQLVALQDVIYRNCK